VHEFQGTPHQAPHQDSGLDTGQSQAPFSAVAPVLGAALLLGAGGGFALATVLTLSRALHASLGPWWIALAQAHGHLQLYGWAGFFVLGVAQHVGDIGDGDALAEEP